MNKENQASVSDILKSAIKEVVNNLQGVRGVDLGLRVLSRAHPVEFKNEDFQKSLEELVKEGEIIEVEYVLPAMNYRVKSFYLPKGTEIRIIKL